VTGLDLTDILYEGRWPWPPIEGETKGASAQFGITANGFWSMHQIHSSIGNGSRSWDNPDPNAYNHSHGFRKYLIQNFGSGSWTPFGNHQYNTEAYVPRSGPGPSVNDPNQVQDRDYNKFDMEITYTPTNTGEYQCQGRVRLHKAASWTEMNLAGRPFGNQFVWAWNPALNNEGQPNGCTTAWCSFYDGTWTITGDFRSARPFLQIQNWGTTQTRYHTFRWDSMTVTGTLVPPTEVWVDDDWAGHTLGDQVDGHTFDYDAFATIGAAIQAVSGSIVHIGPGLYEEQIAINQNDLQLIGSGSGNDPNVDTIILSPNGPLTYKFQTDTNWNYPIIGVHDCTGVLIKNLRVDGFGRGNNNYRFIGIAFWNASGSVEDCAVTRVRDTPLSGAQHGVGIYAYNNGGGPYTVNVTGTEIDDYQKNGMVLAGDGLTANVSGCTVTGSGPLGAGLPAQNGIQISYGASGTVSDCVISNHMYTGGNWAATGLLLYGATSVQASDITLSDNRPGVYCQDTTSATFDGIDVSNQHADSGDGFYAYNSTSTLRDDGPAPRLVAAPLFEEPRSGTGDRADMTVVIGHSTFTGHDATYSWGVGAFSSGTKQVNLTLTTSTIKDWDSGIVAYYGAGYAGPVNIVANYNQILSNVSYGFENLFPSAVMNAEYNWWGDLSGPFDSSGSTEVPPCNDNPADDINANGQGNAVSNNVDYCPWLNGPARIELNTNDTCYEAGENVVTVTIDLRDSTQIIVGGQFFLSYDKVRLDFVSIEPGDSPFTREIYEVVDEGNGTINYAVGVPNGTPGTSLNTKMATITFNVCDEICDGQNLVAFRTNEPPTRLSNDVGQEVLPKLIGAPVITIDQTAPVVTPPDNTVVECDGSGNTAQLNAWLASATANDNCDGALTPTPVLISDVPGCCQTAVYTYKWQATDSCGNIGESATRTFTIQDTTAPTISGCPGDITVNADAGGCTAVVTWTEPTATDVCCGPVAWTYRSHEPGSTFPQGTTTVRYEFTDGCNNTAVCQFNVTVNAVNDLQVTVSLAGVDPNSFTRCIRFELWNCPASSPAATVDAVLSFTNGTAGPVTIEVPCGQYNCITARDRLHTLRRTADSVDAGTYYTANFTGTDALIGGNLNDDFWVDILDFGVFSWQWGWTGDPNTTCTTPYPHADINGDGLVDTADFTFIQANFLLGHEANCCGAPGFRGEDEAGPLTRIAVADLARYGLEHLAVADLNGDGWIDEYDVAAFASGVLPQPQPKPLIQVDGLMLSPVPVEAEEK